MARHESYSDAILRLVKALNETGIKYALTGALIRNGFTINRAEIDRAFTGQDMKFQAFDDKTGFLRVDFFLENSFDRVQDRMGGLKVWFRTFEELVAKKIQYGDLDEVRLLFQRRGRRFRKEKIVRFLNSRQKTELERILKGIQHQPRG